MERTFPARHDLAQRLLTIEAASTPPAGQASSHETGRVVEKLRLALTRFAGSAGFSALLTRSLALAKADLPGGAEALKSVKLLPNGSLEGFPGSPGGGEREAGIALIACLLGLLVTFLGETITLGLLNEAWPGETLNATH